MCRKKGTYDHKVSRRQRHNSASLTEFSQVNFKRTNSYITDVCRTIPKANKELDALVNSPFQGPSTGGPVVSFADFLAETADDDDDDDDEQQETNAEDPKALSKEDPTLT